jgi:hypothetical protein
MADIAAVYQLSQLGKETTPGTSVAANKLMQSLGMGRMQGTGDGTMFRPQGSKLDTIAVPTGMRMVSFPFDGVMTYNEIEYILCSALNSVTPTNDGTNGKKWTHTLTKGAADTKQTYTYENGNGTHAQKATFCQVTDLNLEMSKSMNKVSGTFTGQQITDDITITPTPTEITPIIVTPQSFDVYLADTQAALPGTAYTRPFKVTLNISNIAVPLFRMTSADSSYIAMMETAPTITLKLTTDSDDAGQALRVQMLAGSTKFIQVKSLGAVIAGAIPSQYLFQLTFAGAVIKEPSPTEDMGAALLEWEFSNVYDSTWTKSIEIINTNVLAAL